MQIENEKKYRIKSEYTFKKIISKSFQKSLIFQWYDENGVRTRLEKKNIEEIWTLNIKKELEKGIREEEEKPLNSKEVNLDKLKSQRMVIKNRYLLNSDPEIIVDEILNPNNCIKYKKALSEIKYLLEIEEKSKKVDLDKFLRVFLGEPYKDLEDLTYQDGYNNSDFAGEHNCDLYNIIKGINE